MEHFKEMLVMSITFGVVLFLGDYFITYSLLPTWLEMTILSILLIGSCAILFQLDQDKYEDDLENIEEEEEELK